MTLISETGPLHRLIYSSRQNLVSATADEVVSQIIETAIHHNRGNGVTGLLLVHDGHFVQALEGSAEAVLMTFGRIRVDPRHSDVKVLASGKTAISEFADWHMCARRIAPGDDAILDSLDHRERFEPDRLSGMSALSLLMSVRGIQHRRALRRVI